MRPTTSSVSRRSYAGDLFEWLAAEAHPAIHRAGSCFMGKRRLLMETYPGLRLVLVDVSYRVDRGSLPALKAYDRPTSKRPARAALRHPGDVRAVRSGRLLFGSRLPLMCPGAARHAIDCAGISEEDKACIAGDNLRRLFAEVCCRHSASLWQRSPADQPQTQAKGPKRQRERASRDHSPAASCVA